MPEDKFASIVQNISVLYELSLAIGQSLELKSNCDNFLKALMARKNLGYAAVWIKEAFLPIKDSEADWKRKNNETARLVYGAPKSRTGIREIALEHPIFREVEQISEEQRKSMVNALNGHIAQSEAVYDKAPTKH